MNSGLSLMAMIDKAISACPRFTIVTNTASWMPTRMTSESEVTREMMRPRRVLWEERHGERLELVENVVADIVDNALAQEPGELDAVEERELGDAGQRQVTEDGQDQRAHRAVGHGAIDDPGEDGVEQRQLAGAEDDAQEQRIEESAIAQRVGEHPPVEAEAQRPDVGFDLATSVGEQRQFGFARCGTLGPYHWRLACQCLRK